MDRRNPIVRIVVLSVLGSTFCTSAGFALAGEESAAGRDTLPAWNAARDPAGDDPLKSTDRSPADAFTLRARGGVWLSAPSGDAAFGRGAPSIELDSQLDHDDPEASFTGDLTLDFKGDWDRWLLRFDAFDTSLDSTTTLGGGNIINGSTVPVGTRVRSSLSSTSIGGQIGYDPFGNIFESSRGQTGEVSGRLHLLGGFRALNVDQTLDIAGGVAPRVDYDEWHATAEIGARFAIDVAPGEWGIGDFNIDVSLLGGYGLTDADLVTFDLFTALSWMPTPNAGLTFGYRLFNIDLSDDRQSNGRPFDLDAYFAGIFFGGHIRF